MIKQRTLTNVAYGTHLTPLMAAILNTDGDIVELGTGDYSTPILHEVLKNTDRKIFSYENDYDWIKYFMDLNTSNHELSLIKNWDQLLVRKCGVVFVDHSPANRRIIEIERFREFADIIVVHDTEKINFYGYEPVLSSFKYRYNYERYTKQTTLLSDKINVAKLFE